MTGELRELYQEVILDHGKRPRNLREIPGASRTAEGYNPLCGDRATIYLAIAAKAYAFLQGRGYVTPQDVKTIGMDVLRHRVIVSYEAEAEDMTSESIIKRIFDEVPVP